MEYQVWEKDDFGDAYHKVDCGDLTAAKREINLAVRRGQEPLLTQAIPYSLSIKVEEDKKGEVTKSKAKRGESSRGESDGPVRSGDEGDPETVGERSGDPGADSSAED